MPIQTNQFPIAVIAAALFSAAAAAQPAQTPLARVGGTDGLVGSVTDARGYGAQSLSGVTMRAMGIGAEAWNIGDRPIEWVAGTNQHAVIMQNLYRTSGKRFEQIGMSWAKHVVLAANMPFDTAYGPCISPGYTRLGVNCGDIYSSVHNGSQAGLGPRYDVNPTTGAFTFPFTAIVPPLVTGDTLARRLIARDADLDPALNAGAAYFAETSLYSPDDAAWGNGRNNFSSRKLLPFTTLADPNQTPAFDGPSYRTSALEYWAWATQGVAVSHADLFEQDSVVVDKWDPYAPGDTTTPLLPQSQWVTLSRHLTTRYIAAGAATDNGNGTWTYDYAVLNMNSHRAGSGLAIHIPAEASVIETSFHAPSYHSGDRIRNAPWTATATPGKLEWNVDATSEQATFPTVGTVTLAPNALRFSTVYSFRMTVNRPPATNAIHLRLWRPPADAAGDQGSSIALPGLPVPSYCTADVGGAGAAIGPDGSLNNNDLIVFIDAFFNGDRFTADVGSQGGQPGPDNALNNNDFIVFIDAFFAGCAS
jgi:hypothetical protein